MQGIQFVDRETLKLFLLRIVFRLCDPFDGDRKIYSALKRLWESLRKTYSGEDRSVHKCETDSRNQAPVRRAAVRAARAAPQ